MGDEAIVVGATGCDGSAAAVRYAAQEAARLGVVLRVVHVAPDHLSLTSLVPGTTGWGPIEMDGVGRTILATARAVAEQYLPARRITTELRSGEPATELLAALDGARHLVLGADRAPRTRRVATAATVAAVATAARVPVFVVPSDWEPWDDGRVAVGVKGYADLPVALLAGALRLADEREAVLEVVHVWCPPALYADQLVPLVARADWAASVEKEIRARVAAVLDGFDGPKVVVSALYGDPTHVLQEVSTEVDLLVLGQHEDSPAGHFGSISRALFRSAQCPVVVLPGCEAEGEAAPAEMSAAG